MSEGKKERKQRFKEQVINNQEKEEIEKAIIPLLISKQPKTVRELVTWLEKSLEYPREMFISVIRDMESRNLITLYEPEIEPITPPSKVRDYFFSRNYFSYESWMVLASVLLALTLVLTNPQSGILFYIRYIVVCFYLLILPGWVLTAVIFPELDEKLRFLERVATAIGLSIVVLVLIGLFINYTFRFNPLSIVLTITVFVIVCHLATILLRLKLAKDGFIFKAKNNNEEKDFSEV